MTRRVYTEEERAEALRVYTAEGLSVAWRQSGIPKPTIAAWAHREGLTTLVQTDRNEQTRTATETIEARNQALRVRLRTMLLERAVDVLERMDAPHVEFKGKDADMVTYPIAPAGAVQNYATSAAILIDKYRLEVGEATARNESRDLTHDDHERAALRDAIRSAIAERHHDGQAPDTADGRSPVETAAP